ncbi:MAG: tRNA adenosine(34) deaminase TadA [Erysipelotrichaceae bacterium]|jgi:tRNA(adenine34) deaminase|nr:tRNA adenosine(34) deaminase TadA [Erysipelotrichaceae bacterium]
MHNDEYYMNIALKEASKAELIDEVPIGVVIVKDDKIIARSYNKKEKLKDPTAHAEILAIRKACKKLNSWRLVGATIYVTIEPCSMCAGTILWSRIDRIVYGAKDEKGGALGSSYNLFAQKGINHKPEITGGILSEECAKIIKAYFKNKRG